MLKQYCRTVHKRYLRSLLVETTVTIESYKENEHWATTTAVAQQLSLEYDLALNAYGQPLYEFTWDDLHINIPIRLLDALLRRLQQHGFTHECEEHTVSSSHYEYNRRVTYRTVHGYYRE